MTNAVCWELRLVAAGDTLGACLALNKQTAEDAERALRALRRGR